jgi:hypothetical protein
VKSGAALAPPHSIVPLFTRMHPLSEPQKRLEFDTMERRMIKPTTSGVTYTSPARREKAASKATTGGHQSRHQGRLSTRPSCLLFEASYIRQQIQKTRRPPRTVSTKSKEVSSLTPSALLGHFRFSRSAVGHR